MTTVLVANRGEIALRVLRTCRELGLRTVAVYSTADADALPARYADRAVCIGPGPAQRSYNHVPAIIEAARTTGTELIHPGYGFLSENADFAEVCAAEGFTFVGPPAPVLERLGDKAVARAEMEAAGLPLLPGGRDTVDDAGDAARLADEIGYPVIVKAAAGGGGRGMTIVRDPATFVEAFGRTRAVAQAVFGDSRVYVERYVDSARHVEIQVLCDAHGRGVHLGARDCSIQRRHQKLVEESPAPGLPESMTRAMGDAAVHGLLAAGYTGAGTVEFLVDEQHRHYFMEVNCRLQVEHPVTELVTGLDLVAEQLRVARGEPLGFAQDDVCLRGAAIECRINAEDPTQDFAPTPGVVERATLPGGPFVRVDTHVTPGYRVPPDYDSLLAKLVVWAPDRDGARRRMDRALSELDLAGERLATTTGFLRSVLADPAFVTGTHDTSLLARRRRDPLVPDDKDVTVTSRTPSPPRSPVDRPANLRDVATADPATLRPGVLYRSEAPQPGDLAPTHLAWPPRTVIDLRSPAEHAPDPHPLAAPGTRIVDVPMAAALSPEARTRSRTAPAPTPAVYLDALAIADTWLPALLSAAARGEAPVLVHCAAGKDRTGVAVAVLLLLAGTGRSAVEQDYARTADGLPAVHARLDLAGERSGRPVATHSDVVPAALAAVLDVVAPDPRAFALAHGAAEADIAAWRDRIATTHETERP